MSRNFTFFQSFGEAAMMMPDDERLAFYDAIVRFAILEEEPTDLPGSAKLVFAAIKPIVANSVRDTLNGSQGGRPRKTPSETPFKTPTKTPTKKPNENLMYSNVEECNVNVGEGKEVADAPTRTRFIKPSIDEVKAYAKDMGYYGFNADRFLAYYESNGWKVGRNPMKDWKAAVRNWHAKDKAEAAPKMQPTYDELHPIGDFSNEYTNV